MLNSAPSTPIESAVAIRVEDTSLLYVGFDGFLQGVSRYNIIQLAMYISARG